MKKIKVGRALGTYEVPDNIRKRIVTLHRKGASLLDIANKLTHEGIPTARGGKWYQGTIRAILHQMGISTERYKVNNDIQSEIIRMFSKGLSVSRITTELTTKGLKNARGEIKWHASTVSRIIKRSDEYSEYESEEVIEKDDTTNTCVSRGPHISHH
ncbi:MAG: recombinase family protein [Deltaproteobacteria bacterium]|nr:recombinase family protein [Deltaproteobacteria bacterium]